MQQIFCSHLLDMKISYNQLVMPHRHNLPPAHLLERLAPLSTIPRNWYLKSWSYFQPFYIRGSEYPRSLGVLSLL